MIGLSIDSVARNLLNSPIENNFFTEDAVKESKTMKSNLFELSFVHLEDLIFHETCDFNRVCRLADQIKKDEHLKNPVLVASFSNPTEGGIRTSQESAQ